MASAAAPASGANPPAPPPAAASPTTTAEPIPPPTPSKERPPIQHADTSGYTTGTSTHGYAYAADPEKGAPPPMTHVLRKPAPSASNSGILLKDVDKLQGYREVEGGKGGKKSIHKHKANNFSLTSPPDNSIVVVDEDIKKTKLGQIYAYLLTVSLITRWLLFVVPLLAILWIPGILSVTKFPDATVWGVRLIWWSIWLTVVWAGWWAALAIARILPFFFRLTVGYVAVSTRRYIDWMQALQRYIAFFGWAFTVWASYQPLINIHRENSIGTDSAQALSIIGRFLFGVSICSAILLFEKFSIQYIAGKFHERSYAERIADQKAAVKTLVILYKNSVDTSTHGDSLTTEDLWKHPWEYTQKRFFRQISDGVKTATSTTATVFGNVASEIMGSTVLQPNSPQAIVKTMLESRSKMMKLAQRIFRSFAKKGADYMVLEDIERFFVSHEEAVAAFALFDQDENGDVTQEEIEVACLEVYREQQSIANSMRDLGSAVGRLDNIFMSLYVVIAAVVLAVVLDTSVTALITGAGTLVLGLSWLIGGSCQEILTSIIFLFIKHPYDVGDRVIINKETYEVKEIMLLSTVFLDSSSTQVQAPNKELSTLFIQNIRRSPYMSETFVFDVNYGTTFEDLEKLREKMLAFVQSEKRDFQPVFDVSVKDFPEQTKMTLSADIKYKSNLQHAALKVKRRNKWICALKTIMAELRIYGPSGDPNAAPVVKRYAKVPYEELIRQEEDAREKKESEDQEESRKLKAGEEWKLGDKHAILMDPDVFGDSSEHRTVSTRRGISQAAATSTSTSQQQSSSPPHGSGIFEMRPRTGA